MYADWGTPQQRALTTVTPAALRTQSFADGSMGPKVDAVCRFVEATGKRAAIGRLEDIAGLVAGTAGTQVASALSGAGGSSRSGARPSTDALAPTPFGLTGHRADPGARPRGAP